MSIKHTVLSLFLFVFATMLAPAKALADYTCWNPAICIAVCGSETCEDSTNRINVNSLKAASSGELQRELQNSPRNSSVRDAASAMLQSRGDSASYTCWNPAICIAVCGSKTCGD